jgi:uncharacterized protein (DUF58 family)
MIVPRSRLLFWVAMVVLPSGLLIATEPGVGILCLVALCVLILLCAIDAFRGRRILESISVHLPAVVRMSKDRRTSLEVRIRNEKLTPRPLRFALVLPKEIESEQEDTNVNLPKDHEWSRFAWNCLPRRKGVFRVGSACLEMASPLGLWDARRRVSASSEIRVYPNLLSERKNLAALFLNRGAFGLHVQRQIGKGREFEKLREYLPGDGFEDVHWKATAKRGKPVTKVFQIERTQEIYVVIDASRLAARTTESASQRRMETPILGTPGEKSAVLSAASEPTTALDRYIAAALVLGLVAEQQGDLFGLFTFSDKVERFLRAKNGKTHFSACRDALYTVEPRTVTPDYEELFTFIRLRLRRRALLVFLTALDDPVLAESFVRSLELIRHQHLVLVNMIQPPGVGPVFDGPEPESIDDLYQHLGGHLLWENLCELEKVLQRRGIKFSLLNDERLSVQLVHQYLNAKRRQAL